MPSPKPRRGEVWADAEGAEMLVVSIDSFNRSAMATVVCLGVYEGDRTAEDNSPYAAVVAVGDEAKTVFLDDLFLVRKADLVELRWNASEELLEDAADAMREILTPQAAGAAPAPPAGFPRTGEIRFADLHIEGEAAKPVVVISSEEYARLVEHVFVVACRVTSTVTKVRNYDVSLRSQTGKVVCSDVQTVPRGDITFRTTPVAHVTARERDEIRERVFTLLAL